MRLTGGNRTTAIPKHAAPSLQVVRLTGGHSKVLFEHSIKMGAVGNTGATECRPYWQAVLPDELGNLLHPLRMYLTLN